MNKTDKGVMIGSLIVAGVLLYMIQSAETIAYCHEWDMSIESEFDRIDKEFNALYVEQISMDINQSPTEEELANEWMNTQRAGLLYVVMCGDF